MNPIRTSVLFLAAGKSADFKLSGKFRVYNYVRYLEGRGCRVRVIPWNRHYKDLQTSLRVLERGRLFRLDTVSKALSLLLVVLLAPKYDLVFIQRTRLPGRILWLLRMTNKHLVYDFDDALFSPFPELGLSAWSDRNASLIAQRFGSMLPYYRLVIAGNSYLADAARKANANVIVIPTPVDTARFSPAMTDLHRSECIVGWVGAGEQHIEHLRLLAEPLRQIAARHAFTLRVIGTMGSERMKNLFVSHGLLTYDPVDFIPEAELVKEIRRFTIGVMPLVDDDWSRGKCGFKALLYMSCGIPTIASPVGVNRDIIEHGKNGFLAGTPDEWTAAVEFLLQNPEKAAAIGREARKTVESRFSQEVCEAMLYEALTSLKN